MPFPVVFVNMPFHFGKPPLGRSNATGERSFVIGVTLTAFLTLSLPGARAQISHRRRRRTRQIASHRLSWKRGGQTDFPSCGGSRIRICERMRVNGRNGKTPVLGWATLWEGQVLSGEWRTPQRALISPSRSCCPLQLGRSTGKHIALPWVSALFAAHRTRGERTGSMLNRT